MGKFKLTIIADEDVIDELATYSNDRVEFVGDPECVDKFEIHKLYDNGDYILKAYFDDVRVVWKLKYAIISQAYKVIHMDSKFMVGDVKFLIDTIRGKAPDHLDLDNYPYSDTGLGWDSTKGLDIDIKKSNGEYYLVLHNIKNLKEVKEDEK